MPQLRPAALLAALLIPIAFGLALWGYREYEPDASFWHHLYQVWRLFGLEHDFSLEDEGGLPVSLKVARLLAPASLALGIVTVIFHFSRDLFHALLLFLARRHVVVAGLNPSSENFMLDALRDGRRVVVLAAEPPGLRFEALARRGAICLFGNPADPQLLRRARVHRAKRFVAFDDNDALNLEAAVALLERVPEARPFPPPACHVRIDDPTLRAAFKEHDLFARFVNAGQGNIDLFSVHEASARVALASWPLEVDDCGKVRADPQLVLLGFERGALAVLLQALKIGVYDPNRPLSVHIFAQDDAVLRDRLRYEQRNLDHPSFSVRIHAVPDLVPITLATALAESRLLDSHWNTVVCELASDEDNISLALATKPRFLRDPLPGRMLVRISEDRGISLLLKEGPVSPEAGAQQSPPTAASRIHPFGLHADTCSWENVAGARTEQLARRIHARYHLTGAAAHDPQADLRAWNRLPSVKRDQNLAQADHIPVKLRLLGLDPTNCTSDQVRAALAEKQAHARLAALEHERWSRTHLLAGYTYAPGEKDDVAKTSPWLRPWDVQLPDWKDPLPDHIRQYDFEAVAELPALVGLLPQGQPVD